MKHTTLVLASGMLCMAVGSAQDLISLNFWSIGKPGSPSVWVDGDPAANIATLTLDEGESAGVWETTEWENINLGNPFGSNVFGPVTVTSAGGASATLLFNDRRNSGPYSWNSVRDDSDVVSVGNATLFDGHTNGTEVDGGGGNPWPMAITDYEIQDIPFPVYDVVVYIGANGAQYLTGGVNIRAADQLPADPLDPATQSAGVMNFTLRPGEPDGTLDEVTGPGDTGNYVVFTGLTDPTFRVQVWGDGFNHIGSSGIQIRSATPETFPLVITPNETTPGNYDFEWESKEGKLYDLVTSLDLSGSVTTWDVWDGRQDLIATPPTNTLVNVPGGGDPRRFFAMIEKDPPPPPPLLSENFDAAAALPAGWVSNGPSNGTDWEVGTPSGVASGPAAASSPEYCAGTNIDGYYTENADVSLISPSFAVPAGSGAILTFQHFIDTDLNGVPHDLGSVRILDADNADAPIAGLEIAGIEGDGTAGWTEQTLDLPLADVEGKNLKVEFRFVTNAGTTPDADVWSGFYIDDVLVELVTP